MTSMETELSQLRSGYVRDAFLRLADAASWLEALRSNPKDEQALRELAGRFHAFAGSGTTYGFPKVTALGRQAEEDCSNLLQATAGPAASDLEHLEATLSRLGRELSDSGRAPLTVKPQAVEGGRRALDILVVDDDAQLVELLSRLAREEGLSVRGATTCAAALQAIEERLPDGLIVDIRLPDGSGYDVVKQVRAMPGGNVPAVLILSMLTGFLDKVEAIHCGADGYFEKPVDWDALVRRLMHLLRDTLPEAPRVLAVDDDRVQSAFLRSVLESAGYEVRSCTDPKNFESDLIAFRPDLVLMDIVMPGVSGYDLVRYLRQDERHATLPVLFLTAEGRLDAQIQAARVGGDDYLTKPIAPSLLLTAVAARIERSRFVKSLLERDGLTQLLTHTAFLERAHAVVAKQRRDPARSAAWVMIDLDHFKSINDLHGHPIGDRVLKTLAAQLRSRLRLQDVIGRYGGEEFALLLEDLDETQALRLVNRLREDFAATEHAGNDGACFRATFSAGVAMLSATSVQGWGRAADAALYAAKAAGRNAVLSSPSQAPPTALESPGKPAALDTPGRPTFLRHPAVETARREASGGPGGR